MLSILKRVVGFLFHEEYRYYLLALTVVLTVMFQVWQLLLDQVDFPSLQEQGPETLFFLLALAMFGVLYVDVSSQLRQLHAGQKRNSRLVRNLDRQLDLCLEQSMEIVDRFNDGFVECSRLLQVCVDSGGDAVTKILCELDFLEQQQREREKEQELLRQAEEEEQERAALEEERERMEKRRQELMGKMSEEQARKLLAKEKRNAKLKALSEKIKLMREKGLPQKEKRVFEKYVKKEGCDKEKEGNRMEKEAGQPESEMIEMKQKVRKEAEEQMGTARKIMEVALKEIYKEVGKKNERKMATNDIIGKDEDTERSVRLWTHNGGTSEGLVKKSVKLGNMTEKKVDQRNSGKKIMNANTAKEEEKRCMVVKLREDMNNVSVELINKSGCITEEQGHNMEVIYLQNSERKVTQQKAICKDEKMLKLIKSMNVITEGLANKSGGIMEEQGLSTEKAVYLEDSTREAMEQEAVGKDEGMLKFIKALNVISERMQNVPARNHETENNRVHEPTECSYPLDRTVNITRSTPDSYCQYIYK
uniref:Uncharacterized protein n=1 Tax=Timema tahoe TaxID=61484 RepID=A0A7R9IFP7_9NEOP|nr:unnamed protein product [Timema tahoe]